jgi:hypothetical protein
MSEKTAVTVHYTVLLDERQSAALRRIAKEEGDDYGDPTLSMRRALLNSGLNVFEDDLQCGLELVVSGHLFSDTSMMTMDEMLDARAGTPRVGHDYPRAETLRAWMLWDSMRHDSEPRQIEATLARIDERLVTVEGQQQAHARLWARHRVFRARYQASVLNSSAEREVAR